MLARRHRRAGVMSEIGDLGVFGLSALGSSAGAAARAAAPPTPLRARAPSLTEAQEAGTLLDREGFEQAGAGERPSWRALFEGARPPAREDDREPGEWTHGWQFYASSTRETFYREHHLMPAMRIFQKHSFLEKGPKRQQILKNKEKKNFHFL